MDSRRPRPSRRLCVALALVAMIVAAALVWRPAATAIHTTAFVAQMLPVPLKVQGWITPEPQRFTSPFLRHDGTPDVAEVYVIPRDRPRAAVLMFLGATRGGYDDAEAVKLGYALARTGFVVMYYWSETLGVESRIDPADVANVVAAFQHLSRQDYVDPGRLGLAGFSVGSSYAMVAAADPRIAADIAFVNSFGGYHDLADLIVQIAAGRALNSTAEVPWEPQELTMEVFDSTLLAEAPSAPRDALLAGADGLGDARRHYGAMPAGFRSDVAAISPSSHLDAWHSGTALRVMHDRGDNIIPVGESRRLVVAFAQRRPDVRVSYTETDIFRHVSPDANAAPWPLLKGTWQTYRHMHRIIRVAR